MLFVINKEKIISYFIAFSTVAIILCLSIVNTNEKHTIETSTNVDTNFHTINKIIGD